MREEESMPLRKPLVRQFARLAIRFMKEESGQSTTEYILILAVVVMVAVKFKSTFQTKLSNIVNQLGGQLDGAIQNE